MSLKIRLSRGGAKKRPFYRIVVADARMPRDGRFVEKIGTFDPLKAKDDASRLVLDLEKAKAWLAKGAQPTDRVLRLLDGLGLAKREAHNNPEKAKPKKKAQERAAAAEAAAARPPRRPRQPDDGLKAMRPTASSSSAYSARRRACAARSGSSPLPAIRRRSAPMGRSTDASGARVFAFERLRALRDDMLVVRVKGVETREAAAALTGVEMFARRDRLPPPGEGEYLLRRSRRPRGGDGDGRTRSVASRR